MFLLYLHAISVSSNKGKDTDDTAHNLHMEFTTKVTHPLLFGVHVEFCMYMHMCMGSVYVRECLCM